MGKVITVWGSPGSGKSMFSCILAKALTRDKRKAIIINAEISVPMLPVWLPEQIIQTNASVGQVLSSVEIDTSLVASHVTVLKSYPFIGLMGYSAGENPLSYPEVKYAKAIEAIVSMLMDLQDRENVNLPLYEQQLRETDTAIQNLLNAIQQGILTKSTKGRLEELEATKEELETKIACEKLAKPKVSAEFMTFWLHRFRKLDVRQKSHRKMLIDTFINAIFLYDDKMVITFNYKEGTTTITFDDLKTALADQKTGSDLDCSTAPKMSQTIAEQRPETFFTHAARTRA